MVDEHAENRGAAPNAKAIAAAHAIYTTFMLSFYDWLVHGLSNRFAWRCPTERIIGLYRYNLSSRHLEAGVGTGFFIDRANPTGFEDLTLLASTAIAWRSRRRGLRATTRCCAKRTCWRRSRASLSR